MILGSYSRLSDRLVVIGRTFGGNGEIVIGQWRYEHTHRQGGFW